MNLHVESKLTEVQAGLADRVKSLETENESLRNFQDLYEKGHSEIEKVSVDNEKLKEANMTLHAHLNKLVEQKSALEIDKSELSEKVHQNSQDLTHATSDKNSLSKKNDSMKEKCYASGQLVNNLGMQVASLQDQVRELSAWKSEKLELLDLVISENKQLTSDLADLEKSYVSIDEELTEYKSTNSDLFCRLVTVQKQTEVLKSLKSENEAEIESMR